LDVQAKICSQSVKNNTNRYRFASDMKYALIFKAIDPGVTPGFMLIYVQGRLGKIQKPSTTKGCMIKGTTNNNAL